MDDNRYQPPQSGFRQPPRDREPGSLVKAVLFGAATDIGGTIALGIVLGVIQSIVLAAQGQSNDRIMATLQNVDPLSPMGILSAALGLSMSILGGFVCARVANVVSYQSLGILSAISVAFGTWMGVNQYSWPALLSLNLLSLAAIFFGGWLCIRKFGAEDR